MVSRVPRHSSGQRMGVNVSNDDCCAVDLLLERSATGPQGINNCYTVASSSDMQQRLTRIESTLHLLDFHTATDPGQDLSAKTLARCGQTVTVGAAQAIPAP